MDVVDLIPAVRTALGDGGGVWAKDDFVIGWMNEAIRDIFRKSPVGRSFPMIETLGAHTNNMVFSDEIYKIHYMVADGQKLEEYLYDTLLDLYGWEFLESKGMPLYFWRGYYGGHTRVYVAPTPEVNVNIHMSATFFPPPLDIGDDTNDVLPSSYTDDIIRFCIMRGHERAKDFRASEKAEEQYALNLSERISEATKIDDDYQTITPDPYDFL